MTCGCVAIPVHPLIVGGAAASHPAERVRGYSTDGDEGPLIRPIGLEARLRHDGEKGSSPHAQVNP